MRSCLGELSIYLPLTLLALVASVVANTEKAIFVAPPALDIPASQSGLESLCLDPLTPTEPWLYRQLVPSKAKAEEKVKRGAQSWYLVRQLQPGQRYELRVCWAATQPTQFWIDTYPLSTVFATPELISSLGQYSDARQGEACSERAATTGRADSESDLEVGATGKASESLLLLRIETAADFFTTNETLMLKPPPVGVDIILDPYLANIFPRSLLPTAAWVTAVAAGAWLLSGGAWSWLQGVASEGAGKYHVD